MTRSTNTSLWVCHGGWERCSKLHNVGAAMRDHYLLHYVVSGSGSFKNAGGEYQLSSGQGFLICPNEITSYCASADTPWEYYWVGFKGVDAPYLLKRCGLDSKTPIFTCENIEREQKLFAKMFTAFKNGKGREYAMLAYLYLILSELTEQNAAAPEIDNSRVYLESAVSYISDNYSYDISVSGIAKYIGIDRTYLYRLFVENLGLSPEKYISKTRMTRAASLLKSTDLSVMQISLSVGYNDISHFSNVFKRFFGISPTEFRRG